MSGPTGRESDKFMLRLPDGMRDRIKAAADANSRSMNAEILVALNMYLGIANEKESDLLDPDTFDLTGLPQEEQLRRIVQNSAKTMYRQLKIAINSPPADISNPPDRPFFPDQEPDQE